MQSTPEALMGSARWAFGAALLTSVFLTTACPAHAKRVPYEVREAQRAAAASVLAEQVLEQHLIAAAGVCGRLGMTTQSDDAEVERRARIKSRQDRRRFDRYRAPTFGYRDGNSYDLETSGSRRVRCKGF